MWNYKGKFGLFGLAISEKSSYSMFYKVFINFLQLYFWTKGGLKKSSSLKKEMEGRIIIRIEKRNQKEELY